MTVMSRNGKPLGTATPFGRIVVPVADASADGSALPPAGTKRGLGSDAAAGYPEPNGAREPGIGAVTANWYW